MTFTLRLASERAPNAGDDEPLDLAIEHARIAAPRRGTIAWDSFDARDYAPEALGAAAEAWRERARQEYASLALFTELASRAHVLGAPLDWSGAFARMIADEVRHTELCARFASLLEPGVAITIDETTLHPPETAARETRSLRAHVRASIVSAFCIAETVSGHVFRRCARAATVPLAKDVVRAITDDETFHGRVGWEMAALLMRQGEDPDGAARERDELARALPALFAHYRALCGAARGEAPRQMEQMEQMKQARHERHDALDDASPAPNFGTLTAEGYARAFYDAMDGEVVPALVAIGFPEATSAWYDAR